MRILTKAKQKVAIGFITHNGASYRVAYAPGRIVAQAACEFAKRNGGNTDKSQANAAKLFLKNMIGQAGKKGE